jgi:hypothetical protein
MKLEISKAVAFSTVPYVESNTSTPHAQDGFVKAGVFSFQDESITTLSTNGTELSLSNGPDSTYFPDSHDTHPSPSS